MIDHSSMMAKIASRHLEETVHKAALANTSSTLLSSLKFKSGEGANRYITKNGRCIYIGSIFCYRLVRPIYTKSMKLLRLAGYVLKDKNEFRVSELLAVESIRLYAEFLKDVQRSSKTAIELTGIIGSRPVYLDLLSKIELSMAKMDIPNSFIDGSLVIDPILDDQHIAGDEVLFSHEGGTLFGIIKRVLKKSVKLQVGDNELLTVSNAKLL
jgi:hypothetical protein